MTDALRNHSAWSYNMGTHTKTTIEIADDVFVRAKRQAKREGKTRPPHSRTSE